MRLTKQKRALALVLALAAALSLTVTPAQAGSFYDVTDQQVSAAADALSSLGVVSGTGEGVFSPDGHLTRAQLCKMAIEIMGMGEEAKAQEYRTLFTDMGKNHWARGYVNLAAITQVPAESGTRLMLGLGDGTFGPDREVTYQEAATLVLRILGYGEEANRAWPYSAIETATLLGLDQDLGVEKPADPITRAQTALLFYHLLSTPTKADGKPYAAQLGNPVENAILLASDATINGQSGWVVVAEGDHTQTYLAAGPVDETLLGKRGWAVLDQQGHFITLLPDDSTCITAQVERKEAYYLYLNGQRYTMSEDTTVYTGSAHNAKVTTYKEYMANLGAKTIVTLYLDGQGKVAGLYRAEPTNETPFLIVGNRTATYETFQSLTGNVRDYTIRKNGMPSSLNAIRQYDVVTYDPLAKVMDVCDVRLTCVYENASPNPTTPSRITAAGKNQFEVLADAIWNFSDRKLGESITLLLTSNGKVAGLLPKGSDKDKAPTAALGVLSGDGFQLLGCDLTLTLPDGVPAGISQANILSVYSAQRGTLTLEEVGTAVSNTWFDTEKMTLRGGLRVSDSVQIYERTALGLLARELSELPSQPTVAQYHKNSSNQVDLIILEAYSGEGWSYGRIDVATGYRIIQLPGTVQWLLQDVEQLVFTRGDKTETYTMNSSYHTNGYGAVTQYGSVVSVNYLRAIRNVPSSAFYTQDGVTYVRTSEGVFPVDEDVQCFNAEASYKTPKPLPAWVEQMINNGRTWMGELPANFPVNEPWYAEEPTVAQFSSLSECRNFADTVTVYIDSVGQQVRVVESGSTSTN